METLSQINDRILADADREDHLRDNPELCKITGTKPRARTDEEQREINCLRRERARICEEHQKKCKKEELITTIVATIILMAIAVPTVFYMVKGLYWLLYWLLHKI